MRRKDLPNGTEIDPRDAKSRLFVWLIKGDGERVLCGVQRLCREYGLNVGTFWYRWKQERCPDEVSVSMLQDAAASYSKSKPEGWTVDGVWFSSLRSVATFIGKAENTITERFRELGRRHATFEELATRKKGDARPHSAQRQARTVLCADGQRYTIAQLAESTGLSRQTIWRRAKEKDWVFDQFDLQRKDDSMVGSGKRKPVDPAYMSPRYAHIKLGDLCHLSGSKNTGAGKGEIPDEERIGKIGQPRAINSSVYGITLAAFNR